MYNKQLIAKYLREDRHEQQATLSEVEVTQTQTDDITLFNKVISDPPLCFLLGWLILGILLSAIVMAIRSDIFRLEPLDRVPCKKCRFFSSNAYLKCAVHPYIALTEQAINCADYWPEQHKLVNKPQAKPD